MNATNKGIQDLAAEHAERAIEVLAEAMDDDVAEWKDRLKAAEQLLDRSQGKPSQAIITTTQTVAKQRAIANAKTDEELLAIIEQKQLPSLSRQPMITVSANHGPMDEDASPDDSAGADEFEFIDNNLDPMLL